MFVAIIYNDITVPELETMGTTCWGHFCHIFFFLCTTRWGLARHPFEPVPCLDIQVDEALFAIRGSVQGAVGDEMVSCLRGAIVAVAGGSQTPLMHLSLEMTHARAETVEGDPVIAGVGQCQGGSWRSWEEAVESGVLFIPALVQAVCECWPLGCGASH